MRVVVLRVVAVASLGPSAAFGGFVAAHALGRGAAVATMGVVPVARPDGLGAEHARSVPPRARAIAGVVAVGLVVAGDGLVGRPARRRRRGRRGAVALLARRAFGGITGDVLGAVEQVAECLVLVTVSGLAARHAVWWTEAQPMAFERINPDTLHATAGYHHVTITPAGRTAHLAGQCPVALDGTVVAGGLDAQVDQVVANALLARRPPVPGRVTSRGRDLRRQRRQRDARERVAAAQRLAARPGVRARRDVARRRRPRLPRPAPRDRPHRRAALTGSVGSPAVAHWLLKSEPDVFGYDDLVANGREGWDGVRNYTARIHLRAMRKGDLAIFYHSNAKPPGAAGVCRSCGKPSPTRRSSTRRASTTTRVPS